MVDEPSKVSLPKIPNEVWVAGDPVKIVEEMLLAMGEEHNLTIWYNGIKIHTAEEVADVCPKTRRRGTDTTA